MIRKTLICVVWCVLSFCLKGYADGNHALNQSYSKKAKGLNYVQASGKAGLRFYPPAGSWPVSLYIGGIPANAAIEKAFVYFVTGYSTASPPANPQLYFKNPLNVNKTFTPSAVGLDTPKCWGETGNVTYRADVTQYVTGNGTYVLNSNTIDTATDGFTLLILYKDPAANYTGSIFINDGLSISQGDQTAQVNINVPDTVLNARAFVIVSDIQDDTTTPPELWLYDMNKQTTNNFSRSFWSFVEAGYSINKNQSYLGFKVSPVSPDCYAWAVAGVYMQVADTPVSIAEPFKDSLYCLNDTFDLKYEIVSKFRSNNVFKVYLSDSSGSFSNATEIGSKNSDTAGTIRCVVPPGAIPGEHYMLRVTASSPADSLGNNDKHIRISDYPLPPVVMSNSPVCEGTTFNLFDFSPDNPADFKWVGPDNFISSFRSPKVDDVKLAAAGKYYCIKDNYSCIRADSVDVIIKPRAAKPSVSVTGPVCAGDSLKVTAFSPTPNITYSLLTPAGFAQGLQNVDTIIKPVTIADSGWFKVVAVLDGCLSKVDSAEGTVYRLPALHPLSNSPVCEGSTIELKTGDTTLGAGYSWKGPAGFAAPISEPLIGKAGFINEGVYTVIAKVHFCADTDTVSVAIKPTPPSPGLSSNSPICAGYTLNLFADDSMAGVSYSWTGVNGFSSDLQNPEITNATVSATGMYIAIAELDGCTASDTIMAVVKTLPALPRAASNSPVKQGEQIKLNVIEPIAGAIYKWTGPNGFTSDIVNPVIDSASSLHAGIYTVVVDLDGCMDSSTVEVAVQFDVDDYHLSFYPNPNNGNFTIKGKFLYDQQIPIAVTNVLGQVVYRKVLQTADKKINENLTMPCTEEGCYFIRIDASGKMHKIPFLILH